MPILTKCPKWHSKGKACVVPEFALQWAFNLYCFYCTLMIHRFPVTMQGEWDQSFYFILAFTYALEKMHFITILVLRENLLLVRLCRLDIIPFDKEKSNSHHDKTWGALYIVTISISARKSKLLGLLLRFLTTVARKLKEIIPLLLFPQSHRSKGTTARARPPSTSSRQRYC